MSCEIERDAEGFPVAFKCGPDPKPEDHKCDMNSGYQDIETGMGMVTSATCSICARPAFNMWDIW